MAGSATATERSDDDGATSAEHEDEARLARDVERARPVLADVIGDDVDDVITLEMDNPLLAAAKVPS